MGGAGVLGGLLAAAPKTGLTEQRPASDSANSPLDLRVLALQTSALLERHMHAGYFPGAVALITRRDNAEIIQLGRGALESAAPIRADSIFRISSMTKPVTAVAAMMLVQAGVLHLAEPIGRWLPELAHPRVLRHIGAALGDTVPVVRPIVLEDLLTFRCGWGALLEPPGTYPIQRRLAELRLPGFGPPDPSSPMHPTEWLRSLATLPLMAQPGETWLYNTGSSILGVLLARVTRRSLADVLRQLVFEPLGMKDTGFFVPESSRHRLVSAYRIEAGRAQLYDAPPNSPWCVPPAFPDGAAGLVSTADDFAAFARMLLEGGRAGSLRILSDASISALTSNHLSEPERHAAAAILGNGRGWGYGMAVVEDATSAGLPRGTYGWNGGLGTSWVSNPRSGLAAILLTQTQFTSPTPPAVHREFQRAIFSPPVV